jgi:type IV secretory pathway VirB4 component
MPLYREGNFRRGAHPRSQGFVTMLPYRALVGPGIIQTKYPGFMCGLRLAPPDMESESVETKAHLCEYLAQLFSRLGDGWGTWLNVISRPAIGWPTGDGFTRPTMALIDEFSTKAPTTSTKRCCCRSINCRGRASSAGKTGF